MAAADFFRRFRAGASVLALSVALAGCSGMSSRETTNTALGAGAGALGGALLSGGDGWATAGGAVAGGVLGNVLTR